MPDANVSRQALLEQAQQLLQVGRYREAGSIYEQMLLGFPEDTEVFFQRALLACREQDWPAARTALQHARLLSPGVAAIHLNLGIALFNLGDPDTAMASYQQACALDPACVAALYNLGLALKKQGRIEDARRHFQSVVTQQPSHLEAWRQLAILLHQQGQAEEASTAYEQVLAIDPVCLEALNNLSEIRIGQGRLSEGIGLLERAVAAQPTQAQLLCNLGTALGKAGRYEAAIAVLERVPASHPVYSQALTALGWSYWGKQQYARAERLTRQALALQPGNAIAGFNLALQALQQGRLAEGWRLYEWRWQARQAFLPLRQAIPFWNGESITGKTVLVIGEQGYGDMLQFVRFVPRVATLGAQIVLCVPAPLQRLFAAMDPAWRVVAPGDAVPPADYQVPLLSLPRILGVGLDSIPAPSSAYLRVPDSVLAEWRPRMPAGTLLRAGLAWRGNKRNPVDARPDARRYMDAGQLATLLAVAGVSFVSLQKPAADLPVLPPMPAPLVDFGDRLADFMDTAAVISQLDLVISIDTAVAHLAGALGKPTWLLLPYNADWRWLLGRCDSPWYPTMQLFRQSQSAQWEGTIQRVAGRLAMLATSSKADWPAIAQAGCRAHDV